MENNIIENFFKVLFNFSPLVSVYTDYSPKEMMASVVDDEGWFTWKPIEGALNVEDYRKVQEKFNVIFPKSFIDFHKRYFFLGGDCSIVRLPHSNPKQPLLEIIDNLDNESSRELAKINIYPFAWEGNDVGFLVFDGREEKEDNEFPIRVFDQMQEELDGLSTIIFSSFSKLLECLTHYMEEVKNRHDFEVFPDFFEIDPNGAGKYGKEYWLDWVEMQKANYESLKDDPWPF